MSFQPSNNRFNEFCSDLFTDSGTAPRLLWQVIQGALIIVSCLSMLLENYEPYRLGYSDLIIRIELIAVAFLTIDYLGSLYYAPERMKYTFSFWGLVDLLSILPFYLLLLNPGSAVMVKSLRALRFLRLLVLWRMTRGRF
jgi:voltage-gated potassium channel